MRAGSSVRPGACSLTNPSTPRPGGLRASGFEGDVRVTDASGRLDVASTTAVFDSLVETDRRELEALAAAIGQGRTADDTWDLVLDGHDLTIERISTGDSHLLCIITDRPTRGCTLARIPADLTPGPWTPSDLDGASVMVDGTWYVITATATAVPTTTFAATADGTWIVKRPDP